MPPYFTYTANCSWLGLGTLGPDSLYADASTLTFNLPAQHTSENNMMIVVPDWAEGYGVTGRKVPSGRYDRTFPNTFAWATNIYYSEAPQQTFARFTYL
eukprot:gene25477-11137_t